MVTRVEKKGSLEDFLIGKIKESGYPLEIEISNLLEEDYVVFNNAPYVDTETNQSRNIDIHAMPLDGKEKYYEKRIAPFILRTEIAIECKKSDTHAWVFFTRPCYMGGAEIDGEFKSSVPKTKPFTDSFEWLLLQTHHFHHSMFERIAISYDEIKKKRDGSQRKEIFEAVQQLVKFTSYEIHESLLRRSKLPDLNPEEELIFYLFPVLVFEGDMFEVIFDSGEPKLRKQNHIILDTSYRCPYYEEHEGFIIDVVHRTYFKQFMEILEADFQRLRKAIVKNRDELLMKAKEDKIKNKTDLG